MNRLNLQAARRAGYAIVCALMGGCALEPIKLLDTPALETPAAQSAEVSTAPAQPVPVSRDVAPFSPVDVSALQQDYRYVAYSETATASQFAFPVTYEARTRYNVHWFEGGQPGQDNVELIVVDPVHKTLSLGYAHDESTLCTSDSVETNQTAEAHPACVSRFSRFQTLFEKAPRTPVNTGETPAKNTPSLWGSLFEPTSRTAEKNTARSVASVEPPKPVGFSVAPDAFRVALVARQLNLFQRAEERLAGGDAIQSVDDKPALLAKLRAVARNYEGKLNALQAEYIDSYRKRAEFAPAISRAVKDRSGYFSYDIAWEDEVALRPRTISKKAFNYAALIEPVEKAAVNDALKPLVSIVLSRIKQQYAQDRASLLKSLRAATASYEVVCQYPSYVANYQIRVSCPGQVDADIVDSTGVEVKYEVIARRFGFVLPKYIAYNHDIGISTAENELVLSSSASRAIVIDEVVAMVNGSRAVVYAPSSPETKSVIPARGSINLPIESMLPASMTRDLSVSYITNRTAVRKKVKYGYLVRYRFVGGEESLAFQDEKNFVLNDLLIGRL